MKVLLRGPQRFTLSEQPAAWCGLSAPWQALPELQEGLSGSHLSCNSKQLLKRNGLASHTLTAGGGVVF